MNEPNFRLQGKTAVITGASSGIGAGIAVAMSAAGARTVLIGRDRDRLERSGAQVDEVGETPIVVETDLTGENAPQRIVEETLAATGSIDALVHAAGIFEPVPFLETSMESFDRQWAVNVRAPYAITKAAVPHMQADGSILFISSIAGHVGFPNSSAYCATKGAVELMARALSMELAPTGIRVNALAPGNIRTPMNEHLLASPEYEAAMIDHTPYGRVGVVDDVSPVAVFLASDAARYIHGTSLLVDGGWVAR